MIIHDVNKRVYELEKLTGNEPIVANDTPALFYSYEMLVIMRVYQSGAFGFQWIRFSRKTTDMFAVFV